ncbi:MAG: T9SS type A sorting domain-containing protein [Paludibacteraceae bacterium]|nr:T9SS type A sorting domain-containing protein [Paludibacteraceae bacterium]
MIKKLFASLLLAGLASSIYAESKYMTIDFNNGTSVSFLLEDNPVITYENESLLVNKDEKTTYSFDDIKNYHFTEDDQTAAKMTIANTLEIVKLNDETIEVKNAKANCDVAVYTISGTVASQAKVNAEGQAIVKLPNQTGVYVIKAGKQSFKIIRK